MDLSSPVLYGFMLVKGALILCKFALFSFATSCSSSRPFLFVFNLMSGEHWQRRQLTGLG